MSKSWFSQHARFGSEAFVGSLVFCVTLLIFWFSPVHQVTDSNYSMLASESLLRHGTFALDHYNIPRLPPPPLEQRRENYVMLGDIWQLELINDHVYYFFPPGNSVLSLPFVAAMNTLGISAANLDGTYNQRGEVKIESSLAALLMALLAALFFYMSRLVLPLRWSVVVALAGALGTQVWSTASRALWTHNWGILLLGLVIFMLFRHETGKRQLNPIVLTSLLAWMYFVRPTYAVHILAITVYVFVYHRRLFIRYSLTGLIWLAGFVAYSWHNFHQVLPSYYRASRLSFDSFWTALAGNLISPSRGLLIYVPALLFVALLLARYWRYVGLRRLVLLSSAVIAAHLIVVSGFSNWWGDWWGGASYGARYSTDLVPWFVLLGIIGVRAMLTWRDQHAAQLDRLSWKALLALGLVLLLISVFINARGAISLETWKWTQPTTDAEMRALLWNWRYPQFLAGLLPPPQPTSIPLIETETLIDFSTREADKYLWYGWSNRETRFRWTDARQATFIFALKEVKDTLLQMKLGPFLAPGKLSQQRVTVSLNGQAIGTITLKEEATHAYELMLPQDKLQHRNVLAFDLPDAASPSSLSISDDHRLLGLRMEWILLRPQIVSQE